MQTDVRILLLRNLSVYGISKYHRIGETSKCCHRTKLYEMKNEIIFEYIYTNTDSKYCDIYSVQSTLHIIASVASIIMQRGDGSTEYRQWMSTRSFVQW